MALKPIKQEIKAAVDSAIFTVKDGKLMVLLIEMTKKPYEGFWALPGGLIEQKETTLEAAVRILEESTGVKNVYLEQLGTFDAIDRDPFARTISVAHIALVPEKDVALQIGEKYADVRWWSIEKLPELAYDHKHIAHVALDRLRAKLEYTNIVWSLLPKEFTLTNLQAVYEIILGTEIDKRNFRRKILALKLLEDTGRLQAGEANRPAKLYRFKQRKLQYIDII
jgi:8-oxo-dGTP diphosphatase